MLSTNITALLACSVYLGLLYLASVPYKCKPFEPKDDCILSRYELKIHDVTQREKRLIGMAEGACVFSIGQGKAKRFVMTDAEFHAKGRTDYFDRVEFPAAQSLVCEVK